MRLSNAERLIVAMLANIQKEMKIGGDIDPDFILEALRGGQEWSVEWEYSSLFPKEPATPEELEETTAYLDMWWRIENSYQALSDADKEAVVKANNGSAPKFSGFDANSDPHHAITCTLINKLNRYDEFKGRPLNSHAHVLDSYKSKLDRMRKFDAVKAHVAGVEFNREELIEILCGKAT